MVQCSLRYKVGINKPFWRFSRIKLHQPAWLTANPKVSENERLAVKWWVVQKMESSTVASQCWKVVLCSASESPLLEDTVQSAGDFTCPRKPRRGAVAHSCPVATEAAVCLSRQSWGLPSSPLSAALELREYCKVNVRFVWSQWVFYIQNWIANTVE